MNSDSIVHYSIPVAEKTQHKIPSVFRYDGRKKFRTVQKILFWILDKIGCYYFEERTHIRFELKKDVIDRAIMDSMYEMEKIYGCRPKYVIIGRNESIKLESRMNMMGPVRYCPKYDNDSVVSYELNGLKIIVCPWVEGFFLLPDIEKSVK